MNNNTLIVITNTDLNPLSGATGARMLCYAEALSLKGINTIFTSVNYSFRKEDQKEIITDKIYLLGNKKNLKWYNRKILPVLKELNFFSSLRYLIQLNNKFKGQKDISYLLYSSNFALSLSTAIYFRAIKRNLVFIEKNELQLGVALNMPVPVGLLKILFLPAFFLQVVLSTLTDITEIFFDGMICISTRLYKLYANAYKKIVLIPIITDTKNRIIENDEKRGSELFKIGYTGTLTEKRDGIFTLIKAISLVAMRNHEIECNLFGSITESNLKRLNHLIDKNQLNNIVHYFGNYDARSIKLIQSKQNLLVLPRPVNIQTNFGFSTKLAEYMSSGIPVLTTRHSDISNYIVNGKNGFIIDKLSPELLYIIIIELLNKKDQLIQIGEKGRETAMEHFDFTCYSATLNNFLF
jgi:glycosyltransferase involved in cell wall biosynthesis